MEARIRFSVDTAHCQRAEDELAAILLRQEHAFFDRWYSHRLVTMLPKVLRIIGIVASLLGLALCILLLAIDSRDWATQPDPWFIAAFAAFLVLFYFIPHLGQTARAWSYRRSDKRCRRTAQRFLRIARQLAPFEADYDVKGDLIVYSRGKNNEWRVGWSRKLSKFPRGLAVQASSITAIFRRPTSMVPAIVVLHEAPEQVAAALQRSGIGIASAVAAHDCNPTPHSPP